MKEERYNPETYIAIQKGGHYATYCVWEGYMTSEQHGVISYSDFMKFLENNKPKRPMFLTEDYRVALAVAKALNDSAEAIYFEKWKAEHIRS